MAYSTSAPLRTWHIEGNSRRAPTLDEFIRAFDEASTEVTMQLPGSTLTKCERQHYEAAYVLIVDFADRNHRETEFLMKVAPQLSEQVDRLKIRPRQATGFI